MTGLLASYHDLLGVLEVKSRQRNDLRFVELMYCVTYRKINSLSTFVSQTMRPLVRETQLNGSCSVKLVYSYHNRLLTPL